MTTDHSRHRHIGWPVTSTARAMRMTRPTTKETWMGTARDLIEQGTKLYNNKDIEGLAAMYAAATGHTRRLPTTLW